MLGGAAETTSYNPRKPHCEAQPRLNAPLLGSSARSARRKGPDKFGSEPLASERLAPCIRRTIDGPGLTWTMLKQFLASACSIGHRTLAALISKGRNLPDGRPVVRGLESAPIRWPSEAKLGRRTCQRHAFFWHWPMGCWFGCRQLLGLGGVDQLAQPQSD